LDALVISADEQLCARLEILLEGLGQGALSVGTVHQAREAMKAVFFPLLVVERRLSDGDALELCREYRRRHSDRPVSVVLLSDKVSHAMPRDVDACIDRASTDAEFRVRLARRPDEVVHKSAERISNKEEARLAALESYAILDSQAEREYDDIILLASHIARTPMAALSLVDEHRQWFKSHIGMPFSQTPRDEAFCTHAIEQPDRIFVVNDASNDLRFADNPMVIGAPHVRFYAGASLVTSDGFALGTVCVLDNKPRELDQASSDALAALARQAVAVLEHRKRGMELEAALVSGRHTEALLREAFDNGPVGKAVVSHAGEFLRVNPAFCDIVGYTAPELLRTNFQAITHPDDLAADLGLTKSVLEGSLQRYELEKRYVHRRGHIVWVLLSVCVVRDDAGKPLFFLSQIQDITARKQGSTSPRVSIVFGTQF
jgi:PAS domain S-box-containing protein